MGVGGGQWIFTLRPHVSHDAINGFTEPLGGWGKGPGYEVVIKGRRNLSRDQMFLEVLMSYYRQGMPWVRGSLNPESSK